MKIMVKQIEFSLAKIALLVVLVFSFVTIVGISIGMSNSMDSMSHSKCIFDDGGGCTMNLNQHLNSWNDFFTANVTNPKTEIIFLLVLMPFFFFVLSFKKAFFGLSGSPPLIFHKRRNNSLKLFDQVFQLLFSGILQPKLYASRIRTQV